MYISILVKSALIIYVDEKLATLLGQSAKNWIDKRPIDYLYKHDTALLLTKMLDLTSKVKIEPFFLRFKKENTFKLPDSRDQQTNEFSYDSHNTNISQPRLILHSDSNEYVAFLVELKTNKIELKQRSENNNTNDNKSGGSLKTTTTSRYANSGQPNQDDVNMEACIMMSLSYPTISYFDNEDTKRSFTSQHDFNLKITQIDNT
jgi:hypothetical protein